jgi:hypothetical protein
MAVAQLIFEQSRLAAALEQLVETVKRLPALLSSSGRRRR